MSVTVANVRALCWLYGADTSMTDALADLAAAATRGGTFGGGGGGGGGRAGLAPAGP